jgi:hypothetical protein
MHTVRINNALCTLCLFPCGGQLAGCLKEEIELHGYKFICKKMVFYRLFLPYPRGVVGNNQGLVRYVFATPFGIRCIRCPQRQLLL